MKRITIILATLTLATCQKQPFQQPKAEEPSPAPSQTLQVTGYFNPKTCQTFFDARITDSGLLLHDDTVETQNCQDVLAPFQLKTFLFPVRPESPDSALLYRGLKIESQYPLTTENFKLATLQHPNLQQQATHLYSFSTPGKYILQVFFPESSWQSFIASADKLELAFQVTNTYPIPPKPTFTLIEGTYNIENQILHLESVGPEIPIFTPEFQFQLINSQNTIHIRSIYTLLTEDFSLWQEDTNCQTLQNWDLTLSPATGYYQLEAKLDPPFLECLRTTKGEALRFRVALLK